MLAWGGGKKANVLIVPQASEKTDAGEASAKIFHELGAEHVTILDLKEPQAALAAVHSANVIWMPGGEQARLMKALQEAKLVEPIRNRFAAGATVGGTSAGAAVMSPVMIPGNPGKEDLQNGITPTSEGLGLWPEVIVDQHFVKRSRFNRLQNAVRAHPNLRGVGIDEATAVLVSGRTFEVVGQSTVTVIDARQKSSARPTAAEQPGRAVEMVFELKAGGKFDLDRGILAPPEAR